MGIRYSAAIVVGLPYEELCSDDFLEKHDYDDWASEHDIEDVSPYYDADREDWVVGFICKRSPDFAWSTFEWDQAMVDELKQRFNELTGKEARVFITPYGF